MRKGITPDKICALALIILLLPASGCGGLQTYEFTAETMGTVLSVTIYDVAEPEARSATDAVLAEVERLNDMMSVWQDDSPMSRLNREAGTNWVITEPEIINLLQEAMRWSEETGGAFDVSAGPLIRLWGFLSREEQQPPTDEQIADVLVSVGYNKIHIDKKRNAIRFDSEDLEVDLGGIAKGYAVDRALEVLKKHDVEKALVNLGGNIGSLGSPPGRDSWKIAVRDPRSNDALIGTLSIPAGQERWGIASSGQYNRFFEYEGRKYGHIIDPRTGYPAEDMMGTTALAPSAMEADILSTAMFVLGGKQAVYMLRDNPRYQGMVMMPHNDGGLHIYISSELSGSFELMPDVVNVVVQEF